MTTPAARRKEKVRAVILVIAAGLLICFVALVLIPIALITFFRTRRLYTAIATRLARAILLLFGIHLVVHRDHSFPTERTVYISNHSSTLDVFVLAALGLPNTRFFLTGARRKWIPLGIITHLMGTFFTVPQTRPAERTRIFQRAERVLRRTGESVYLSPEGGRITTGEIGHFNKGAFHLATALGAPIVPFYFQIPPSLDPGIGYHAKPGVVHVYVKPPIETYAWRIEDLLRNTEDVREMFIRWHRENQELPHGSRQSTDTAVSS